jgi:hypothetical protein
MVVFAEVVTPVFRKTLPNSDWTAGDAAAAMMTRLASTAKTTRAIGLDIVILLLVYSPD